MNNVIEKQNKLYNKKLRQLKKSKQYIDNETQINCIKKVLIEHADVPESLLDSLIKSVEENALLTANLSNSLNTK